MPAMRGNRASPRSLDISADSAPPAFSMWSAAAAVSLLDLQGSELARQGVAADPQEGGGITLGAAPA